MTTYQNYPYKQRKGRLSWMSFIIGLISIGIGVWCICTPLTSFMALTVVFIASFFTIGFFELCMGLFSFRSGGWGWRIALGIVDLFFGLWLCLLPLGSTAMIFIYIVAFWIFFSSVIGICECFELKRYKIKGWGWMLTANIVGIICAFLFMLGPIIGQWFTVVFCGAAFICYGCYRCTFFLS